MSRFIKDYHIDQNPTAVFSKLYYYLKKAGFHYIELRGENVFEAGREENPFHVYFKFSSKDDIFRMETWILQSGEKGAYEIDYYSQMGTGPKTKWQSYAEYAEGIITGLVKAPETPSEWKMTFRNVLLAAGIVIAAMSFVFAMISPKYTNIAPVAAIIGCCGLILIIAADSISKIIHNRTENPILFGFLTPAQIALLISVLSLMFYTLFGYILDSPSKKPEFLLVIALFGVQAAIVLLIVRKKIVNRKRAEIRNQISDDITIRKNDIASEAHQSRDDITVRNNDTASGFQSLVQPNVEPVEENKVHTVSVPATLSPDEYLDDITFIRSVQHIQKGGWQQYNVMLASAGYGWDMMKDWADYMTGSDLNSVSEVTVGNLGASSENVTLSYANNGGKCNSTPELDVERGMLSIAGMSKTLLTPVKIVWINQTNMLRLFTFTDNELTIRKYVETMVRRTFGTENAMKLGKQIPDDK